MVRFARELFAMGNKKITEALGVPLSTTKRWLQQRLQSGDEMMFSDHVAQRLVCVCCLSVVVPYFRIARHSVCFSVIRSM